MRDYKTKKIWKKKNQRILVEIKIKCLKWKKKSVEDAVKKIINVLKGRFE